MKHSIILAFVLFPILVASVVRAQDAELASVPNDSLIVVVGAAGDQQYEGEFEGWAAEWNRLGERQSWNQTLIGAVTSVGDLESPRMSPRMQLKQAIESSAEASRLWIVLLGHGTVSGKAAKFNLVGPDVSSTDLASWIKKTENQVVVINCSSSSSPFLTDLAGADRIVVTATRSSSELNYSRFGKFLSSCINDPTVDIDHDSEVSLLEAFLSASALTERFYEGEARLTTEHALLEDNGDRVGTSADFYRGIRPVKQGADGKQIDGSIAARIILLTSPENATFPAELAAERQTLEQELDRLRAEKSQLPSDEYFDKLESLLLRLSAIYDAAEAVTVKRTENLDET